LSIFYTSICRPVPTRGSAASSTIESSSAAVAVRAIASPICQRAVRAVDEPREVGGIDSRLSQGCANGLPFGRVRHRR
jgi:hypothetical protein